MPKGIPPLHGSPEERFELIVDRDGAVVVEELGPCWEWTGKLNDQGYARFTGDGGRRVMVHRWSYEHFVGPIPAGLFIDHLCDNPPCVNPAHLAPTTNRLNGLRGRSPSAENARKTHCARAGHPLYGANLYVEPSTGRRRCRVCYSETQAQYRARVAAR